MLTVVQKADIYMFDEPSSYLDVKQRIKAAKVIRSVAAEMNYVIVVEHDLSILDIMSDYICCIYGEPGAYGVITKPFSTGDGIKNFLAGYIPTENMRFRAFGIDFNTKKQDGSLPTADEKGAENGANVEETKTLEVKSGGGAKGSAKGGKKKVSIDSLGSNEEGEEEAEVVKKTTAAIVADEEAAEEKLREEKQKFADFRYGDMRKEFEKFSLDVEAGSFNNSEITVLMGENGTGKTTFIKMLAGKDKEYADKIPQLDVAHKPQKINPKFEGTVNQAFEKSIGSKFYSVEFKQEVLNPLNLDYLYEKKFTELSGGELQRVSIAITLGKEANVYLFDEPSAYLDCEQRMIVAKILKRFVMEHKKAAFVVEHDLIMATYLADQMIVFDGQPGIAATAHTPKGMIGSMNKFLRMMEITFRRDRRNLRPRINRPNGRRDKEQKRDGKYFITEESS
jgi:ATP-binding cassette subfamily E protein 1